MGTTEVDDQPLTNAETDAVCRMIAKRQRYPRGPRTVGDAVNALLARRGYANIQSASNLDEAWRKAAGEKIANATRCGKVSRGVLEVVVLNSSLMQELAFQKKRLLAKLAQLASDTNIKDLRFRVGEIR